MKKSVLWVLCIFAAAMLIFSFPAREHISELAGDAARIAGFAALMIFITLRSMWRSSGQ